MRSRSPQMFRPSVERTEGRILATASPAAMSWIELVNPTKQSVSFELSGNGGISFHGFKLKAHSSASYHVTHAIADFLIEADGGASTLLPTGPTKRSEPAYDLHSSVTAVPVAPTPGFGGGGGGIATDVTVTIYNMTKTNYTIQFSSNNKTVSASRSVPAGGFRGTPVSIPSTTISYRIGTSGSFTPFTPSGDYNLQVNFVNNRDVPFLVKR